MCYIAANHTPRGTPPPVQMTIMGNGTLSPVESTTTDSFSSSQSEIHQLSREPSTSTITPNSSPLQFTAHRPTHNLSPTRPSCDETDITKADQKPLEDTLDPLPQDEPVLEQQSTKAKNLEQTRQKMQNQTNSILKQTLV